MRFKCRSLAYMIAMENLYLENPIGIITFDTYITRIVPLYRSADTHPFIGQQIPSLTWKCGSHFFSFKLLVLVGYMMTLKNLTDARVASSSILKLRLLPKWQLNIWFG